VFGLVSEALNLLQDLMRHYGRLVGVCGIIVVTTSYLVDIPAVGKTLFVRCPGSLNVGDALDLWSTPADAVFVRS
jgi:hypothetical protein